MKEMTRKEFLLTLAAGAAFTAIGSQVLLGCNSPYCSSNTSTDNTPSNGGNCLENGGVGKLTGPHDHSFNIAKDDVNLTSDKTYSSSVTNGHSHKVTVSVAQLSELKKNNSVSFSITDGHTHSVTLSCS